MLNGNSVPAADQTQTQAPKVVHRRTLEQSDGSGRLIPVSSLDSITSVAESTADFASPKQAVIIFDWDDTLCPTHWIRDKFQSLLKPPPDQEWAQKPLKELEAEVLKLLDIAEELGRVVIVTNALEPWVITSCKNFFPGLLPIVEKIPVVYARSIYTKLGIDTPDERPQVSDRLLQSGFKSSAAPLSNAAAPRLWKENAFHITLSDLHSEYERQSWKNIVCIGDSPIEHEAVRMVTAQRPTRKRRCYTKTAKFLEEPTIQELIAQVKMLQGALPRMVEYEGGLDIEIGEDDIHEHHHNDPVEHLLLPARHSRGEFEDSDSETAALVKATSTKELSWLKLSTRIVNFRSAGKMMMTFCQGWEGG
eukprot:gnl/MRDRNA2_/MRDRNA2_70185_c0_seq1.p1 gnl/MRDRNA2_/MRDRNA2_70185_c0~~gnl/MRDRNA2_/MRDRNA2_70185_c0_seq1.p1  ORF type:complete len:363 (-),score=71.22 gnl/MRDRNA2_/MRDRNA2_70185_c0_seq1:191-1279(-)